jgi:hypothetical protein
LDHVVKYKDISLSGKKILVTREPSDLIALHRRLTAVSPPQKQRHDYSDNQDRDIEALHDLEQGAPVLAEEVAGACDYGDPEGGSEEVEEGEGSPAHAEDSGEGAGEDAEAEDEAGKENGDGAVAGKEFFAAFESGGRDAKESCVAVEERPASVVAESVAEIVSDGSSAGGDDDDPSEMEFVFGIGEEASEQESALARNGDAGVFAEEGEGYGPVSVVGDEGTEGVEDCEVHGVTINKED